MNIYELGLVYNIVVADDVDRTPFAMTLTSARLVPVAMARCRPGGRARRS